MPGFDNNVMFADNVDFSGSSTPNAKITSNGQLLIGSSVAPKVRVATLSSLGGTVTITNGNGTINLEAGASTPTIFTTDSGNAVPVANIINILGGTGMDTSASGNTVTVTLESPVSVSNGGTGSTGITGIVAGNGSSYSGRTLTQPSAGITVSNANGSAGNPTLALADDLAAVEGLSTNGLATRTSSSTWTTRSLAQPAAGITISNSDGVSGNPTFALANDLAAVEGLSGTGVASRTASDTWATSSITNHAVLVGNGTQGITNIGPLTNGQLVIGSTSNDPVAASLTQPAAGLTITGGAGTVTFALANDLAAVEGLSGTGLAVRTASDTWTTRTITAGSGISISNGDGVSGNPTISTTGSFTPSSVINLSDDFIAAISPSAGFITSELSWRIGNLSVINSPTLGTAANPGIISNTATASGLTASFTTPGVSNTAGILIGGGAINLNWVLKLATLSNGTNRYKISVGIFDDPTPIANGVYFTYVDNVNSGNWVLNAIAATVATTSNTSTAATTSFVNLGIQINAAGTSATFTINGSSVGTVSTNLPTAVISIGVAMAASAGTVAAGSVILDLMYMSQTLTTPR